ncbi:hypothetical protein K458DRAFT_400650 [Lentithecium fluviatile CBS 122367]|uniref:Uncharacterized protein n=1 Tax=Lentithecium fluviatile CBS 122367 TaxID=1168545 RepID=A0A6G1JD51_9PLEO|nr:hypothetical protein K458DRAFT_400650 [Lentithecium fluviatile CBS 122367]
MPESEFGKGTSIVPFIDLDVQTQKDHAPGDLILKRARICRRRLHGLFFMFDLLAHSTLLFDAYSPEQASEVDENGNPKSPPIARIMFERYKDRKDPDTGMLQPHIAIRKVDIGKPYRLRYQANESKPSWYQFDTRVYECFDLDGYYWTKQIHGKHVNVTLEQLVTLTESLVQSPYDVGRHACHDARELIMAALGVEKDSSRLISRVTDALRPSVAAVGAELKSASQPSSSNAD